MKIIQKVKAFIQKKLKDDFVKNLGWLGGAQAFIRISRLAATFILPRFLSPNDYGLAALVLTVFEFTQTLTRIGINAKVIQSDQEKLEEISNSAFWLNWIVYVALFFLQCLIAFPVAWFYRDDALILPICLLGITYLIAPIGRVQAALIIREKRLKVTAFSQAIRYSTANVLTAVFAVLGFGMWAIVLPILLASPLEPLIFLSNHKWRPNMVFTTKHWGEILKFGSSVLGIQMLKTFRENLDYLIVGRFIGVTELGFYYFAYNAGLGVSLTIINSITTALYPHLCTARRQLSTFKQTYISSLKTIAVVIVPFALLQSFLAPFYVPIVFGEEWIEAIPILILVCLSAIPRAFDVATFQLLATVDKPQIGLVLNLIFTGLFSLALLLGVKGGVMGVAIAVLAVHVLLVPVFAFWAQRYVFSKFNAFAN